MFIHRYIIYTLHGPKLAIIGWESRKIIDPIPRIMLIIGNRSQAAYVSLRGSDGWLWARPRKLEVGCRDYVYTYSST